MPRSQIRRRTDYGTVILHAVLVVSFVVLTATGLRIASDNPNSLWLRHLDPILPGEDLWFIHFLASIVLTAVLAGYTCYVVKARLLARTRIDMARIKSMVRPGRERWGALSVVAHWVLMCALAGEVLTGWLLFAGHAGAALPLHLGFTFLCLATIAVHVALHAAYGGLAQLLSIVRAGPLRIQPPTPDFAELLADVLARQQPETAPVLPPKSATVVRLGRLPVESPNSPLELSQPVARRSQSGTLRLHPFATALAVGVSVALMAVGAEQATRPVLRVVAIGSEAKPALDGDLSDPVWVDIEPVQVMTTQGGDFGGSHQSLVEIRAIHDGEFAYFAFVWEDPTRSLKHLPLFKSAGKWYLADERSSPEQELTFHEDKFAILLTRSMFPLIGGAIHLGSSAAGQSGGTTERGLHYTTNGSIADVWQWRASHNGPRGFVEDSHFGPMPNESADPDDRTPTAVSGFGVDPGGAPFRANFDRRPATARTPVVPRRLPLDLAVMRQAMGRLTVDVGVSEEKNARWWMTADETEAFSQASDSRIPDGTVIPSILISTEANSNPDSILGSARWAAGHWALEIRRRLIANNRFDLPIRAGALLWVAAFDHAEKRHTRHIRPFSLEVD